MAGRGGVLLFAMTCGAVLIAPSTVRAQVTVGPLAAFHDDDIDFGVGAFASIPAASLSPGLSVAPSFVLYFPDGASFFEVNGDIVYEFDMPSETSALPFVMAGLNVARLSLDNVFGSFSETELGLNLGGGIKFRSEKLAPFVGAKFKTGDFDGFVIFGGVGFRTGG